MKKTAKILIPSMLAVILLISAAIVAIKINSDNTPTELVLIEDGELTLDRIVFGLGETNTEKGIAKDLAETVNELANSLGVPENDSVAVIDSETDEGKTYNAEDTEIYVGHVPHPEADHGDVAYGDYTIKIVGNKIILFGHTEAAIEQAAQELDTLLRQAASAEKGALILARDSFNRTVTVDGMLSAIPIFDGAENVYEQKVGNGAKEIALTDINADSYSAYISKLNGLGYTETSSSSLANNEFAVLNGEVYTINTGYYANDSLARIIIEPLAEPFGLESDNEYTAITTPQITTLGVGYTKSDGTVSGNGACVIFRLSDGRFIIIDGGHNRTKTAEQLLEELKRQSAEYAETESDITVAAWILTHGHGDHTSVFRKKTKVFENINVENVILNFANQEELIRAGNIYGWEKSESDYSLENAVLEAVEQLGADLRITHPGHTYHIADAKIETLYTVDMYKSKAPYNRYNTTSVVMKITIGDTVYMSLGDSTVQVFQVCHTTYGDYLKSDIVQIAHHGYNLGDGSTDDAKTAYRLMAPSTVFWTQGSEGYERYKSKEYSLALTSPEQNPNIQEVLVSGDCGDRITLTLPYKPGNAEIVRAEDSVSDK